MENCILKILPNIHCEVYLDGEFQLVAHKNTYTKLNLRPGEYDIELLGTYNRNYKLSYSLRLADDKIIRADFISEAKRHTDWHQEEDFVCYNNQDGIKVWQNLITTEVLQSSADEITDTRVDDGHLYFIGKKDGLYALLNASGQELTPFIYESIKGFSEGLAPVKHNGKWGFVNNEGKEIIPCNYGITYDPEFRRSTFKQHAILTDQNGNYGMINSKNETIIPFIFRDLQWHYDQHGQSTSFVGGVQQNRKFVVMDLSGTEIISGDFGKICIYRINNSFVFGVGSGGKWVDTKRKNRRWHYLDALWGLYNIDGTQLAPCIYDEMSCYDDGGIIVTQSGLYGLINASGETILECKYDQIDSLEFSWYRIQLGNKYGIANIYGDATPCQYEEVWVNEKHLIAKTGDLYGIFSHYGVPVIPSVYQEILDLKGERFSVKLNGKWGIINSEGEMVVPIEYDLIKETYGDGYIVCRADHIGLIDWNGHELLPCIYDAEHELIIEDQALGSPYSNIAGNADFLTFTIDGEETYYDLEKKTKIEPYRITETYDVYTACEFSANSSCYKDGGIKFIILKEDKKLNRICITKKKGVRYGLENIMGNIILSAKYECIERYGNAYQVWDTVGCLFYDKYGNLLLSTPTM